KWRPGEVSDKDFVWKDGQRIRFGYKDSENMISACMAESKTVDILCIEEISAPTSGGSPFITIFEYQQELTGVESRKILHSGDGVAVGSIVSACALVRFAGNC
ncbi:MAG: hypothetical protein AAFO94_17845, partial [Bacteroidota bacterium]